ncbi:hypothetical protein EG329_008170 [Mollisiaceae sp. DMI_Dod_QoI]|nr:hypothetical protein EG329_008170 [Helotiales sp. DMI_Dod_QoI]
MLRKQVRDAYKEAEDYDQEGNKWKWGADYYKDKDADENVWEDMLLQCRDYKWVRAWRMSSDPGNITQLLV